MAVARGRGRRGRGRPGRGRAGASRCPRPTRRRRSRSPGDARTSAWKFLDGGWRRVKRLVAAGFDAGDRQVRPTVTQALELLVARVRHRGPRRRALAAARPRVGARRPRGAQRPDRRDPAVHGHARGVAHAPRGRPSPTTSSTGSPEQVEAVRTCLSGLVVGADDLPMTALRDELRGLTGADGQALVRAAAGTAARPRRGADRAARPAAPRRVAGPARARRRRGVDARGPRRRSPR